MGAMGFAATGWRWLFGLGVVVALIGVAIRTGITESPLFEKKEAAAVEEDRSTFLTFLRHVGNKS